MQGILRFLIMVNVVAFGTVRAQTFQPGDTLRPPVPQAIRVDVVENNVFVPATLCHGNRCTTVDFILDTGTNATTVDQGVAQILALPVVGAASLIAPGGTLNTDRVQVESFRIGQHAFTSVEATVQNTRVFARRYNRAVGGLLGMDLLKNWVTRIDYTNKTLRLGVTGRYGSRPTAIIPLHYIKGLPVVSCRFSDQVAAEVVVDTGCDCVFTLYDKPSRKVHLDGSRTATRTDASGIRVDETIGEVDNITCGNLTLTSSSLIAGKSTDADDYGVDARPGMLGNVLLSRYVVELDPRANELRLYKSSNQVGPRKQINK